MPPPSITVFRGFESSGYYTWSPFVTKLEARLRFAGVPYNVDSGSPMKAPRGKIPYVQLETPDESAQTIGDSNLIIKHLIDEGVLGDCNAKMSLVDQAHDYAVRALLEDKLYFYQVRASLAPGRWLLRLTDAGIRKMDRELLHYASCCTFRLAVSCPVCRRSSDLS